MLGEAVAIEVLARCSLEVDSGLYLAPKQRTSRLLAFRPVELDRGAKDGVVAASCGALVVEVILGVDVGLLLDVPEEGSHRVVENDLRVDLGCSGVLGVEIGDLKVLDQVLVRVRREETAFHRIQVYKVVHHVTVVQGSVVGCIERRICGVEDEHVLKGAQTELHSNVMVLQSNNWQGLAAGFCVVERDLSPDLDDWLPFGVQGISVVGPVEELVGILSAKNELVNIDVDRAFEFVSDLHVRTGRRVDLVVADVQAYALEHCMTESVRKIYKFARARSR